MLFIRPVHDKDTDELVSLALCTTDGELLTDGQILCHFDAHTSGVDIKVEAKETWGQEATWGRNIGV